MRTRTVGLCNRRPKVEMMCRPWDKSRYTEYYDLEKQAKKLSKQLLQSKDKSTDCPDPSL